MKLSLLRPLEANPFRLRGDEDLQTIANSIESFKKMMSIRKIIIDENNKIIGGNKRYFALKMLGYKTIPDEWIDKRTDLSEAEKQRFIVTDNSHFGSTWDYELLKDWDVPLADWGVPPEMEAADFSGKNKELDMNDFNDEMIIKLKYTEAEYLIVKEQLSKIASTPEQAVWNLLNNA